MSETVKLGTIRHNQGKAQLSYIHQFGPALRELADVCTMGAEKYSRLNWQNGGSNTTVESLLDSVERHIHARLNGELRDLESNRHHLAHAAWGCLAAMWWDMRNGHKFVHGPGAVVEFQQDLMKYKQSLPGHPDYVQRGANTP